MPLKAAQQNTVSSPPTTTSKTSTRTGGSLGLDPGNEESALVQLGTDGRVLIACKLPNADMRCMLRKLNEGQVLAVEMIASYGMPVGAEVFETCLWVGRYMQLWEDRGGSCVKVYRKDVKMYLCGQTKAKDANVRQAIIDKYGGKDKAIGNKKNPGPLYGVKADEWAALGVVLTSTRR